MVVFNADDNFLGLLDGQGQAFNCFKVRGVGIRLARAGSPLNFETRTRKRDCHGYSHLPKAQRGDGIRRRDHGAHSRFLRGVSVKQLLMMQLPPKIFRYFRMQLLGVLSCLCGRTRTRDNACH